LSRQSTGVNVNKNRTGQIMADQKECPLCGENMRLRNTETTVHVPGNPSATSKTVREWVCPECDYFEEAEG
jgi:YgiT-type zinc finger domain-containing protein